MRTIILVVLGVSLLYGSLLLVRRATGILTLDAMLHEKFFAAKEDGTGLTKDECLAKGGDFRKPGPSPVEICQIKSSDGGNSCVSGFQCEWGSCVSRLDLRAKTKMFGVGQCTTYRRVYGCVNFLSFGLVTRSVCLD